MILGRPTAITDAVLTATDVPETDYAEFSMGDTYGIGDRRIDSTGVEILTLDVAPATAWEAGDLITGQTSAKTCRAVSQLTSLTYQVRERTGAFTPGEVIGVTGTPAKLADQGAAFPTVTAATDRVHRIYESLKAANTANYPPDNCSRVDPWWLEVSATNRHKIADGLLEDQTAQAESMSYTLAPGLIDMLFFANLDATEITIVMTDSTEGEVYNETFDLIYTGNVFDGWTYCFEPIIQATDLAVLDLPPYGSATVEITIANPGGIAKCGEIIPGLQSNLGITLKSTNVGITSYSTKTADTFGNLTITKRPNAKKGSYDVRIPYDLIDEIYRLLSSYESVPAVWIGIEGKTSTYSYGYFKDFGIPIEGPLYSVCNIEIEGLKQ